MHRVLSTAAADQEHAGPKLEPGPGVLLIVTQCLTLATSASFSAGISVDQYGRWLSRQRRFHHTVGTGQVLAATYHDRRSGPRQPKVDRNRRTS